VGQEPYLKDDLLSGRLNVVRCPACGSQGHLGTPLLYHDPGKELCLCLIPLELQLKAEAQERLVGTLTNALMDSLPPDERRAYMFQPETHLTMQSFLEAILLADGITPEMLDAQARRVKLVQELLEAGDEERLTDIVKGHHDELDYEFYLVLTGMMESAREAGDEVTTRRLSRLRERLLILTGGPVDAYPEPWPEDMSREAMIQELLKTPGKRLPFLVEVNRPAFDYAFFLTLTDQIESARRAGDTTRKEQLQRLRDRLVDLTMEIDRRVEEAVQQALSLLRQILESDDPKQVIRENLNRVDDLFLAILASNVVEARAQGNRDVAEVLDGLYGYILSQLEEQLPPDIRLLNRLLRIPDAGQRARVMKAEKGLVTQGFLELVRALREDAQQAGETELSARLAVLVGEVEAALKSAAHG